MNNLPSPADKTPVPAAKSLFRLQAVEHVGSRQYGTVMLTRSASSWVLTALFSAIAIGIIAFFTFFSTTRKAQCQGVLLPSAGVLRVLPGQTGIIKEVRVKEGQAVREGDVLFVLSSERSTANANSANQAVSALLEGRRDSFVAELRHSSQQARQRMEALQRRASDFKAETERLNSQLDMQKTRVSLAEQAYRRFEELQKTNYLSAAQLQDKQAEVLDQRQRQADMVRAISSTGRELSNVMAELSDLQVQRQRDQAALTRNISTLEQDLTESEARREILVRAPKAGMVTAITADVGQTVGGNLVLASVLPAGAELEAEIYAPSRSAGFIKPGMTVLLRYQAYPYQKFGQYRATVHEVANTALRADELAVPGALTSSAAEPLYRIRLKLDKQNVLTYGKQMPLKSGMLVDASVHLEHRRLYEWVLEPVFSISGRI